MSFIGGYQSDINLSSVNYIGDFPADHTIGGYGVTAGINTYTLALSPAITSYRTGMVIAVNFTSVNSGDTSLNVCGLGPKAIRKVSAGSLVNLANGDLTGDKIYLLIYDGMSFQIVNSGNLILDASNTMKGIVRLATPAELSAGLSTTTVITPALLKSALDNALAGVGGSPAAASETVAGILEIASQAEVDAGTDNQRAVSPQKLATYVAARITGLWKDMGVIDCTIAPGYPAGKKGEAYTVSLPGLIGGPLGISVEPRDVIYCTADNPGGMHGIVGGSWTIIQANLVQATETIAGYAKIATSEDLAAGLNDTKFVTPLKLKNHLTASAVTRRTQMRYYSETIDQSCNFFPTVADFQTATILVNGLPGLRTINTVSLTWEGRFRLVDTDDNFIRSGVMIIELDGAVYDFITLPGKISFNRQGHGYFKFSVNNLLTTHPEFPVTNAFYQVYFSDFAAQNAGFTASGKWCLEIDFTN